MRVEVLEEVYKGSQRLCDFMRRVHNNGHVRNRASEIRDIDYAALVTAQTHYETLAQRENELGLPPRADGVLKVPEASIPRRNRDQWKGNLESNFQRRKAALPHSGGTTHWTGPWSVGDGGHSDTAMLFEANKDDSICDRMLRKDRFGSERTWADMTMWDHTRLNDREDDLRNGDIRLPLEITCHHDLAHILGKWFQQGVDIANLQSFTIDNDVQRWIMYLDYCAYGDLQMLIRAYRTYNDTAGNPRRSIPEPFLWRTLMWLAIVGLAMEKGHIEVGDAPSGEWHQVIHQDLEPQNVFVDSPGPNNFSSYPTLRLGDFGIAIKTWQRDSLNPLIFVADFQGIAADAPPEQCRFDDYRDGQPVDDFKLLSHTNVYGRCTPWSPTLLINANVHLNAQVLA